MYQQVQKKEENYEFATVQVPGVLPRIIPIPDGENHSFILLEQIIEKNIGKLFVNYEKKIWNGFS